MLITFTLKDDAGGKLKLVNNQLCAVGVLGQQTLNYTVVATDANGWAKELSGTVVVGTAYSALLTSVGGVFAYSGDMADHDVGLNHVGDTTLSGLPLNPTPAPSVKTFINTAQGSRRVTLEEIVDILESQ